MASDIDPLNIDELIRQAREQKARWRPPNPDEDRPSPGDKRVTRTWQELMEERIVPYKIGIGDKFSR